jgi:hypothetical protein
MATGRLAGARGPIGRRQPSNQRPDDAGSTLVHACERAPGACCLHARVQEHVRERVPDLAKRSQHMYVISILEHPARAPEDPIHRSCQPRPDRGFDDQVSVLPL